MKRYIFIFALCALALVWCEDKTIENDIPSGWSPEGHIYINEEKWEGSTAIDKYWVYVLDFFSKDSALWYQTDLRSLEYNGCPAYAHVGYDIDYTTNKLTLYFAPYKKESRELYFIDTTTIHGSIWGGITYTIFK